MNAVSGVSAMPRSRSDRLGLRQVPMILMYHGVATVADDPNKLCVTPSRFAEQMAWLARRGLRGVSVGELVHALRANRQRGLVGITFDDGYVNVLDSALPELQRHRFGATVFVISGRLGGTNDWEAPPAPRWPLLSASQVQTLAAAGIEIGSHGVNHIRLATAEPEQVAREVRASRATLAALVGTEIRGFAYPYGSQDVAARIAVRDAGYDYACAVAAKGPEIGLLTLPRVYVGQRDGEARMALKRLLYRGHLAIKGRSS